MSFVLANRVKETTTSPGTGTATLSGAVTGYQSFSAGIGANNTTYYTIADQSGSNWEVGYGTVGAGGTTLARTTVLASSNSGSLVNFASGTQNVWVDYPASKAVIQDSNGVVTTTVLNVTSTTSSTPNLSFNASNSGFTSGASVSGSYLQTVIQNKSGTAGASTNYVVSNDLGTDSTYYGEFGMNSSVYSASTPSDFFSINNGIYFSGHDGDISVGSSNGYKTYMAWGTTGNNAHVINASGAIGLSTNLGTTPSLSGTTGFGTSGQVLTSQGSSAAPIWATPTTGTVTSITAGTYLTGGTITTSGTLAVDATTAATASKVVARDSNANVSANNVLEGYTAVTSAAGTTVLTAASTHFQKLTGTLAQTFQLPDATSLPQGFSFLFDNDSTGVLTINDGSGGAVDTVPSGNISYIFLETAGSTAGSWGKYSYVPAAVDIPTTGTLIATATALATNPVTGTPSSSNFLRGDGTWATPASGITVTNDTSTATALYPTFTSATSGSISGVSVTSTKLTFVPSTGALSSTSVAGTSDERLKTNWTQVAPDFLDKLASVKSGIYDRTDVELTQAGVSAQSLQEVLPEAVLDNGEGYLSVAYGNAALVAAIELAKEVKALRAEIEILKAK